MEDLYTKHIETWGKVERKGKKNPYTSHNGHMFTFFDTKENYMAVRLSKEEQEAYFEATGTGPVIQYNSEMRGYIRLTDEIFEDYQKVESWLEKSWKYINSLKPKPSTKRK